MARKRSRAVLENGRCNVARIIAPDGFEDHWCTYHAAYVMGCIECGVGFHSDRCDTRYCSNACRQRAYRRRKAAGLVSK